MYIYALRITYFKESACDTVFMVTMDALRPHLLIKGKYSVSYAKHYSHSVPACIQQAGLAESDRYFYYFFVFHIQPESDIADLEIGGLYIVVYDKENKTQEIIYLSLEDYVSEQRVKRLCYSK